jgi:hypothetical protein
VTAELDEPTPLRPEPLDLAALARRHPVRVVQMDMAAVIDGLSTGDMADIEASLGVGFADIKDAPRFELLCVLAWVLARREQPDLELAEVRRDWRIENVENPTPPPSGRRRRSGS